MLGKRNLDVVVVNALKVIFLQILLHQGCWNSVCRKRIFFHFNQLWHHISKEYDVAKNNSIRGAQMKEFDSKFGSFSFYKLFEIQPPLEKTSLSWMVSSFLDETPLHNILIIFATSLTSKATSRSCHDLDLVDYSFYHQQNAEISVEEVIYLLILVDQILMLKSKCPRPIHWKSWFMHYSNQDDYF